MIGISDIVFFVGGIFFAAAYPAPAEAIRNGVKAGYAKAKAKVKEWTA